MGLCSARIAFAAVCADTEGMATMSTDPRARTGERVREERHARGWSQQDAVEAGKPTSMPSWRKVETGAADASDNTCAAVDRAFGWVIGTTKAMRAGEIDEPTVAPPAGSAGVGGDVSQVMSMLQDIQRQLREQQEAIDELRQRRPE